MIVMFVTGVCLALCLGVSMGILYTQHQRSVFTKKYTKTLTDITKEYDKQLKELQFADKKAIEELREKLKSSLMLMTNPSSSLPPEGYN